MQVQRTNSYNFKGLQCHPNYGEIQYIIATKMSGYGFEKTMAIIDKLATKKAHTDIYLGGDLEKPKIYADIAGKTIKENFFFGPYTVVKKVLKIADKLDKAENI